MLPSSMADKITRRQAALAPLGLAAGFSLQKPLRAAVIGATGRGDYGHDMDVVWLDVPGCEVVGVADENEAGRAKASVRLKGAKPYADYQQMLRDVRPEVVSIGPRWLDQHRDMVLACADAGVKGVLCEKPLCRSPKEADEMVAACDRSGMKVALGHQTRYSPKVAMAKRLVEDGRIGDLLEVHARTKEDGRGGGEDFMVLGDHLMDLLRHFLGNAEWCFGRVTDQGKPITKANARRASEDLGPIAGDAIHATYGFAKGVTATVGSSRVQHGSGARYGMTLYGTKGAMSIGFGFLPPVFILEDPSWNHFRSNGAWKPVSSAGIGLPEPHSDSSARAGNREIVKDLLGCLGTPRQPVSSIHEGRAVIDMLLAPYASQLADRPVKLPLADRRHPLE